MVGAARGGAARRGRGSARMAGRRGLGILARFGGSAPPAGGKHDAPFETLMGDRARPGRRARRGGRRRRAAGRLRDEAAARRRVDDLNGWLHGTAIKLGAAA